jgi:hypothetical protein
MRTLRYIAVTKLDPLRGTTREPAEESARRRTERATSWHGQDEKFLVWAAIGDLRIFMAATTPVLARPSGVWDYSSVEVAHWKAQLKILHIPHGRGDTICPVHQDVELELKEYNTSLVKKSAFVQA